MSDDGHIQIRSFRNCFRVERRIHKVDRWRIPLPFGLPLRGLAYGAVAELTLLTLDRLPVAGVVVSAVPAAARYVVLPVAFAYMLTQWALDGRPAHAVLRSWVLMRLRPRRVASWRGWASPGT